MGEYVFSVQVQAPPEAVFGLWTDVQRMHEWTEGISRVSDIIGPAGAVGSSYTLWFGRMRSPAVILEAEPAHHIRTRFGNVMLKGESDVTFDSEDGGTRLTQRFRTEGLIPAVTARIFATGSYRGSFRGELAAFVRIAEREAHVSEGGAPSD
jgi:uncharacterized protein YndB with AHSA1/START domain